MLRSNQLCQVVILGLLVLWVNDACSLFITSGLMSERRHPRLRWGLCAKTRTRDKSPLTWGGPEAPRGLGRHWKVSVAGLDFVLNWEPAFCKGSERRQGDVSGLTYWEEDLDSFGLCWKEQT